MLRYLALALLQLVLKARALSQDMTVTPVVKIEGKTILACGLQVSSQDLVAELVLADTADGRAFILAAKREATILSSVSLTTGDTNTATAFDPPQRRADGSVTARGVLPGLAGSEFIRSLLVEGGSLEIVHEDSSKSTIVIPGPLSQAVRATYLNCAGDLPKS